MAKVKSAMESVGYQVLTAKTVEEFSAAIDKALAYTPQQRAMLERFSRQSGSWRARYEQILALLTHKDCTLLLLLPKRWNALAFQSVILL